MVSVLPAVMVSFLMVPIEIKNSYSSRRPVSRSELVHIVLMGHSRQAREYVTYLSERIFAVTLIRLLPLVKISPVVSTKILRSLGLEGASFARSCPKRCSCAISFTTKSPL